MSTIRNVILSLVLATLVIAAVSVIAPQSASLSAGASTAPKSSALYAVVNFMAALPVNAAQPSAAFCPGPTSSSFSTAQLRYMLNARYEHRVGLPR